ncbi:hypothetical protein GA0061101_1318 [Rhizobium lusitanum]|jgi:hypothetical protein|uniref:Uncharacterized protein n=1 Tax=Rhizobium lusitanum TaxID=293958 RepID=A0A1C3XBJ9_9HYPH|nr:hypothetical protein [Rhizobium sp. SG741]SCB49660.1 hypothetical protein GA0061101_1318 [Rhizobium lusitanum]
MTVQKQEPQWWSDIIQAEIRLPQKGSRRLRILPPQCTSMGAGGIAIVRKFIKACLARTLWLFRHQPTPNSAVSCADPLEAYMYACMMAPVFCYVSPTVYGLTVSNDERGATRVDTHSGDDL